MVSGNRSSFGFDSLARGSVECVSVGAASASTGRGRGSAYTPKHIDQIQRVLRLQREGVTLETIEQLPEGTDAAESARRSVPATVVLRADGSVAEVLPRSFASADEIAAAVDPKIGVSG